MKKLAVIFISSVFLLLISACAGGGADIPISRLKFGMSEEQVKSVVKAAPDEEYSDDPFVLYKGSLDLAEGVWRSSFYCGDGGLNEIFLISEDMPREECFAARNELMKKLSGLYGLLESNWKIENDSFANLLNYQNENGQLIQLYIRLWEQEDSASITMIFKSYDDISVIPKK